MSIGAAAYIGFGTAVGVYNVVIGDRTNAPKHALRCTGIAYAAHTLFGDIGFYGYVGVATILAMRDIPRIQAERERLRRVTERDNALADRIGQFFLQAQALLVLDVYISD